MAGIVGNGQCTRCANDESTLECEPVVSEKYKRRNCQVIHASSPIRAMVLFDDLDRHHDVEKKHGGQSVLIARALGPRRIVAV